MNAKKNTCTILIAFLLLLQACSCEPPKKAEPHYGDSVFEPLCMKLESDGFSSARIKSYYSNPAVRFEQSKIAGYFRHNEASLDYGQFLSENSIDNARKYMDEHNDWFERAKQRFGVEGEIITAILLVETRLGNFLGESSTFNILSSLAALEDPGNRKAFWKQIRKTAEMSYSRYENRAKKKAAWAYAELKALIKYMESEGIDDPTAITGSYAGASGIPQFMPSNIIKLAVDGDMDGRVDLYTHPDAIMSVASFLNHYGWRPGMDRDKAYSILLNYNRSSYYANTILEIYEKLQNRVAVKQPRSKKQ